MSESPVAAKVMIAVAPNGARRTKVDHPAIPLSPAELAACAAECLEAGAGLIHLHVRDRDGGHLLDADAYLAATAAIRAAVGNRMVIQITTEAVGRYQPAEQMAVVRATRPEAVSLAVRELAADAADEAAFADFLAWVRAESILPQFILYDQADAIRLEDLRRRGVIPWNEPPVLYVLGRYSRGQTSAPADLLPFLAPAIPQRQYWSVCAFGKGESACATTAALLGGGIRIGFENNILLPTGEFAVNNQQTLLLVAKLLKHLSKFSMNSDEIRSQIS